MTCPVCCESNCDFFPCSCKAGFHVKCFGKLLLNGFWKRCSCCAERWRADAVLNSLKNAAIEMPEQLLQKALALLQCGLTRHAKCDLQRLKSCPSWSHAIRARIELAKLKENADESLKSLRSCAKIAAAISDGKFLTGLALIYGAQAYLVLGRTSEAESLLASALPHCRRHLDLSTLALRSVAECAKRKKDTVMQVSAWGTMAKLYSLKNDQVGEHACEMERAIVEFMNGTDSSQRVKASLLVLRKHARTDQPILKRGRCFLSAALKPKRRLRRKTHPEDL